MSGYEGLLQRKARIPADSRQSILDESAKAIVRLYQDEGQPEKAALWQARLQTASSSAPAK